MSGVTPRPTVTGPVPPSVDELEGKVRLALDNLWEDDRNEYGEKFADAELKEPAEALAALSVLARRAEKLEAVASAAHLVLLTASPYFADSPLGVLSDALAGLVSGPSPETTE